MQAAQLRHAQLHQAQFEALVIFMEAATDLLMQVAWLPADALSAGRLSIACRYVVVRAYIGATQ